MVLFSKKQRQSANLNYSQVTGPLIKSSITLSCKMISSPWWYETIKSHAIAKYIPSFVVVFSGAQAEFGQIKLIAE